MAKKTCPRCRLTKPHGEFNWRDTAHTKLQSFCRECSNSAWREWYAQEANRTRHIKLVALRRKRRIERHQSVIHQLKSQPCADCGQSFPYYVMDFDHVAEKTGEISSLMRTVGTERVMEEIQKCEVVCSNCHRIRTFQRIIST